MSTTGYSYREADIKRIIAAAVEKYGPNEAKNLMGYIGGQPGNRQIFSFTEHRQKFYRGHFRKIGTST